MTDLPNDRIAALAARRAGNTPGENSTTAAPTPSTFARRKRRPHAAAGGRILATGLSVGAALVMAGVMASDQPTEPVATQSVTAAAPVTTAPQIVVRVVMVPATAAPTAGPTPVASAPKPAPAPAPVVRKAPVKAKAVATSRGS